MCIKRSAFTRHNRTMLSKPTQKKKYVDLADILTSSSSEANWPGNTPSRFRFLMGKSGTATKGSRFRSSFKGKNTSMPSAWLATAACSATLLCTILRERHSECLQLHGIVLFTTFPHLGDDEMRNICFRLQLFWAFLAKDDSQPLLLCFLRNARQKVSQKEGDVSSPCIPQTPIEKRGAGGRDQCQSGPRSRPA